VLNGVTDARRFRLQEGSLQWLFPALVDASQADDVLRELARADEQLVGLGRILVSKHARKRGTHRRTAHVLPVRSRAGVSDD